MDFETAVQTLTAFAEAVPEGDAFKPLVDALAALAAKVAELDSQ